MYSVNPAQLVVTYDSLHDVVSKLNQQPAIAVDTESNSLHAYKERVCLIQFSTNEEDFIVDPIAIGNLDILQPVFANRSIEKVFHAAEYDLICLWRDFGWKVNNIFDTMVAARALGWERVGLAAILSKHYAVPIDKKFQRADWAKRPLNHDQLFYAQLDTHYLLKLRDQLAFNLRKRRQWSEVHEEFERIAEVSIRKVRDKSESRSNDDFWKITGARKLSGKNSAVLCELYKYREQIASMRDLPTFRIIGDATLLGIAKHCPRNAKELSSIKGMTPGQIRRYKKGVLKAVDRGVVSRYPSRPKLPRPDPLITLRYESLREWRKIYARRRGVASDVIIARDILWSLAVQNPTSYKDLELIQDLGPWRRKKYGKEILRILVTSVE
tara:strand:+ start:229 stop:1377 length:1149 start_codon:yes stop_codon:yes gene_type:complete